MVLPSSEKNDPHIRILAAFLGSRQGKLYAENSLGLKAIDDHQARCKSAVFWQTERLLGIFSTGTEKGGFTGLSGTGLDTVKGNGTRFGLIFVLLSNTPHFNIYEVN